MARPVMALVVFALCSACATEQRTTVVAADPPRRLVIGPSDAQLIAESQAACTGYGLLRGTAAFDRCVGDEFAARRPG
jgi:hypothetical protein